MFDEKMFVVLASGQTAQTVQALAVFGSAEDADKFISLQAIDWWFDVTVGGWVMGDVPARATRHIKMHYHVMPVPFMPMFASLVARAPANEVEAALNSPIFDRFMENAVWTPPARPENCPACGLVITHAAWCPSSTIVQPSPASRCTGRYMDFQGYDRRCSDGGEGCMFGGCRALYPPSGGW